MWNSWNAAARKCKWEIPGSQIEMMKKIIPLERAGTVEEAAGVIFFLASPLSNYVPGQVIEMTGGM